MTVVDIGVAADFEPMPGLIRRKIMRGTRNLAQGPAMTREEAEQALQVGVDVFNEELPRGLDMVATGDMGIGNTTPSSAIVAAMTGYLWRRWLDAARASMIRAWNARSG